MTRLNLKRAVFLRLAMGISQLSTCSRLQVGAVITDRRLERVYSVGYNGNAAGEPNQCDREEAGACGCVHAEANALVKCHTEDRSKILFSTTRPCLYCSKLIVNSGFSAVFFLKEYRVDDGASEMLTRVGIEVLCLPL